MNFTIFWIVSKNLRFPYGCILQVRGLFKVKSPWKWLQLWELLGIFDHFVCILIPKKKVTGKEICYVPLTHSHHFTPTLLHIHFNNRQFFAFCVKLNLQSATTICFVFTTSRFSKLNFKVLSCHLMNLSKFSKDSLSFWDLLIKWF